MLNLYDTIAIENEGEQIFRCVEAMPFATDDTFIVSHELNHVHLDIHCHISISKIGYLCILTGGYVTGMATISYIIGHISEFAVDLCIIQQGEQIFRCV